MRAKTYLCLISDEVGARSCARHRLMREETHRSVTAGGRGILYLACGGSAEGERKHREHFHRRGVITSSDERREIKTRVLRQAPCQSWTYSYTFGGFLTPDYLAAAAVLHFNSDLELFFG